VVLVFETSNTVTGVLQKMKLFLWKKKTRSKR
jgi:hypothetical protein